MRDVPLGRTPETHEVTSVRLPSSRPEFRSFAVIVPMAIAVVLCAAVSSVALAASAPGLPSAFSRPAVPADRLPRGFQGVFDRGGGLPYDSRRIATLSGTKRQWSVYIFKQRIKNRLLKSGARPRVNVCLFVFTDGQGGGGGCSPTAVFFGAGRQVNASSSRVFAGVATDRVARVVVIGSQGVVHEVPLSPDHGFIFNCRAYDGCACVVSRLQAFDRMGRRITNQDWVGSRSCRRR
jgi:hypothetical protein